MRVSITTLEKKRLVLQAEADAQKEQAERNRLGQFATPTPLAFDILKFAATIFPKDEKVRFLDPAVGTGSFYSALSNVFPHERIAEAVGFEIDSVYAKTASGLWGKTGLDVRLTDFTNEKSAPRFNLIICNPPYVRHHHLNNGNKVRLRYETFVASGMKLSGLAGLYCHFLGLAHAWMAEGGVAGWLIPSEFMDVNYGLAVKQYLLDRVTLLHVHRFAPNDVQFADALVSSAVVWLRKSSPPRNHAATFSCGGSLLKPTLSLDVPARTLEHETKWTRFPGVGTRTKGATPVLGDFFHIKRGLVTGENEFFILNPEEIASFGLPMEVFRPILPSPRFLPENEIPTDRRGVPQIERRLFLLDTHLPEEDIRDRFPALFTYLQEGKSRRVHEGYICRHRKPWYGQEDRPPSPFVCTYMGRGDTKSGRPFRFILNHSRAFRAVENW